MITKLCKEDGTDLIEQEDMKNEVMDFYGKLMGTADSRLEGIVIMAMRAGN